MNLKILITYKDLHPILNSDVLIPVQTGRRNAAEKFPDMIGDDTGENISDENNKYSELTAQYWAWKNYEKLGSPDYIGHMQYRRHFIFNDDVTFDIETPEYQRKGFSVRFCPKITDDYIRRLGLEESVIAEKIENADIVAVKKADMTYLGCQNAKEDFLKNVPGSRETDYLLLEKTVVEKYPEYCEAFKRLNAGPHRYFYHMFIMRRDLFFEYCEFVFPVLFALDSCIDYENRGSKGGRVLGYLGEFCLSLFIFKKESEGKVIKEFDSSVILDTKIEGKEKLSLPKNDTYFCYYVDDRQFHDFIVSVLSIDKYIETQKKEKLLIFYREISEEHLEFIKNMSLHNFELTVLPSKDCWGACDKIWQSCAFLRIYDLLSSACDRIIFLSSELFFINEICFEFFTGVFHACKHPTISYKINTDRNFYAYTENILGLKNGYDYFSDKLIIARTEIKSEIEEKLRNLFFAIKTQQDILNYCFSDFVQFMDSEIAFELSYLTRRKYFSDDEYVNAAKSSKALYMVKDNITNADMFAVNMQYEFLSSTPFAYEAMFCLLKSISENRVNSIRKEMQDIHFPRINEHFKNIDFAIQNLMETR